MKDRDRGYGALQHREVFTGRKIGGGMAVVRVEDINDEGGVLIVSLPPPAMSSTIDTLSNSWQLIAGEDLVIREIQVLNNTGGAVTFSLALCDSDSASPVAGDAWLAWGTSVGANSVWSWQGKQSIDALYLYGQDDGTGIILQVVFESVLD